ncbi:MAG: glycosyltransferase family 9 protein [Actinobacteria bacterium]|nr:glycosyltransferase family 9 protein [Actinomycetota bacterium]
MTADARPRRPLLLALRALGLGDLLTVLPALRALGAAYPGHRHVLVTTPAVADLALHAGVADEVVLTAPLEPVPPLGAPVDVAVNLHGKGPQSHRLLLALSPRRLIAFRCGEVDGSAPVWREDEHEVHRWCRLLAESGIAADARRLEIRAPDRPVPDEAVGATLLHPGAASPVRRWPAERWAQVARAEAAAGHPVVVTGGPSEVALAQRVASLAGLAPSAVLAGRTSVLDLAAVVGAAARVVCGDTGVAHLATALCRPSVVLFGPVAPSKWGPPPERPWHMALWAGREGDPMGDDVDPGLLEIGVDEVLGALARLPVGPA